MCIKKLVLLLSAFLLLCGCAPKPEPANLQIDKEASFFSDFYVEGDTVYIRCNITVANSGKEVATFGLYADFPDDVEPGLLKSERLQAYNNDDGRNTQFEIGADELKAFSVLFIGEYGGTYLKHDRNLPEIEIIVSTQKAISASPDGFYVLKLRQSEVLNICVFRSEKFFKGIGKPKAVY